MLLDYNIFRFYATKANRQYDTTENRYVLHHFLTNKIPAFQLVVEGTITTATYKLYDVDDNEISTGAVTVENDANEAGTAFSRLIFLGTTLSGKDDGLYYLEVTYDGTPVYGDVFCWQTDLSGYLKILATTSNMTIGAFELNMTDFSYEVYLEALDIAEDYAIEEEGSEKTYGVITMFGSRNHIQEFEVTGYRATHNFLSGLRTVQSNGSVTLSYKGDTFTVYDIELPEKKATYNNGDLLVISVKFKRTDYLQTRNII